MATNDPTMSLIQAAAQRDAESFAARMADSSLEAAVDIWLRRVARRKATTLQRAHARRCDPWGPQRDCAAEPVPARCPYHTVS